jgi:hypothetical protein
LGRGKPGNPTAFSTVKKRAIGLEAVLFSTSSEADKNNNEFAYRLTNNSNKSGQ